MPDTEDGLPSDRNGSRGKHVLSPTQVTALLRENYRFAQYQVVQYLAEHLSDCRRTLDGDLDDMMILAVLGQRKLGAVVDHAGEAELADERSWMSALRIADVTGVPRETTRRKLAGLRERGWVEQNEARGWRLAGDIGKSPVARDLADLDRRGMERLGRMIATLLPLFAPASGPEKPD